MLNFGLGISYWLAWEPPSKQTRAHGFKLEKTSTTMTSSKKRQCKAFSRWIWACARVLYMCMCVCALAHTVTFKRKLFHKNEGEKNVCVSVYFFSQPSWRNNAIIKSIAATWTFIKDKIQWNRIPTKIILHIVPTSSKMYIRCDKKKKDFAYRYRIWSI